MTKTPVQKQTLRIERNAEDNKTLDTFQINYVFIFWIFPLALVLLLTS